MRLAVRQATPIDAPAIARLIRQGFHEDADAARIVGLLPRADRPTFVAVMSAEVVGFVDCFKTIGAAGDRRLEIDLLAVSQSARGKGVGRRLIAECLRLAGDSGVTVARALIATDNHAMRRICHSADFQRGGDLELYVASQTSWQQAEACDVAAHFVRVDTLTYSGIWIEGDISQTALRHGLWIAQTENRSTVGALIDNEDEASRQALDDCAFRKIRSYNWWRFNPKTAQS